MKIIKLIIQILLLIFTFNQLQAKKGKNLVPQNHRKKVTIISSGKDRSYYSLSEKKESIIITRGPGILRTGIRRFAFLHKEW